MKKERTIDRLYDALLCRLGLREVYELKQSGYLLEHGWLRTFAEKRPVDRAGEPVPWMNYAMVDFLAERAGAAWRVFEYGAGASTAWWAKRAASVTACEHDEGWYRQLIDRFPANVKLLHVPLDVDGAYCRTILKEDGEFDVVVSDGRDRVRCALNALPKLSPGGVLILDDFEREKYAPAKTELAKHGFRCLAIGGMKPRSYDESRTAVFYRPGENVLGL